MYKNRYEELERKAREVVEAKAGIEEAKIYKVVVENEVPLLIRAVSEKMPTHCLPIKSLVLNARLDERHIFVYYNLGNLFSPLIDGQPAAANDLEIFAINQKGCDGVRITGAGFDKLMKCDDRQEVSEAWLNLFVATTEGCLAVNYLPYICKAAKKLTIVEVKKPVAVLEFMWQMAQTYTLQPESEKKNEKI